MVKNAALATSVNFNATCCRADPKNRDKPIKITKLANVFLSFFNDFETTFFSKKKANAYKINPDELLICADTIVYRNLDVFGKPQSKQEAIKMLQTISHKKHYVVTGVTLKTKIEEISFYDRSIVHFKKLSKSEILFYVHNYNTLDKAGGYGIQDWIGLIGVKKISGSFYNVMGLPTVKIYENILKLKR